MGEGEGKGKGGEEWVWERGGKRESVESERGRKKVRIL